MAVGSADVGCFRLDPRPAAARCARNALAWATLFSYLRHAVLGHERVDLEPGVCDSFSSVSGTELCVITSHS